MARGRASRAASLTDAENLATLCVLGNARRGKQNRGVFALGGEERTRHQNGGDEERSFFDRIYRIYMILGRAGGGRNAVAIALGNTRRSAAGRGEGAGLAGQQEALRPSRGR